MNIQRLSALRSYWLPQYEGRPGPFVESGLISKSTAQMGSEDAARLGPQESREDDRRPRCQIQRKLARHEA